MKQQTQWSANQPPEIPQKAPHLYSWQILTLCIAAYLCSIAFMSIASSATNGTNAATTSATYQTLVSLAVIALLCLHCLIIFIDAQNFFTLNGKIQWRSVQGWSRVGIIAGYLAFWIMPAVYLFLALKYFFAIKELTKGANISNQRLPAAQIQDPSPARPLPAPSHARALLSRICRVGIYLIGVFVAEFGIFGIALYGFNSSAVIECGAPSLGLVGAGAGLFFFFHQGYHLYGLRWVQYVWWLLGVTIGGLLTLLLVFGLISPLALGNVLGSCVLALYGIALVWLAWLQPSLGQSVALRVAAILHALPGKQLTLPELITLLQREYSCAEKSARHYIRTLGFLELVELPGLPVPMCRLKPSEQAQALSHPPTARMNILPAGPPEPAPGTPVLSPPVRMTPGPAPAQAGPAFVVRPPEVAPPPPVQRANQNQHLAAPGNRGAPTPPLTSTSPAWKDSRAGTAIKIFFCYAREDKELLDQLEKHLSPLKRLKQIMSWHDREIQAGTEWEKETEKQLSTAHIILLLISPDFFSSDYCYSVEMKKALDRQKTGKARVVPIILRPVDWQSTLLKDLQVLPAGGRPITLWSNRDQAFAAVAQSIREIVEALLAAYSREQKATVDNQVRTEQPPRSKSGEAAEVELIRARCQQGKLIITSQRIRLEPAAPGLAIRLPMLLRSSLSGIESTVAAAPVLGMGGCVNLTFRGKGGDALTVDAVPIHTANAIVAMLNH